MFLRLNLNAITKSPILSNTRCSHHYVQTHKIWKDTSFVWSRVACFWPPAFIRKPLQKHLGHIHTRCMDVFNAFRLHRQSKVQVVYYYTAFTVYRFFFCSNTPLLNTHWRCFFSATKHSSSDTPVNAHVCIDTDNIKVC